MSALRFLAVAALLIFVAGCASVPDAGGAPGAFVATASPAPVSGTSVKSGEYHISPGDLLDISVFQVPTLNREVQVDAAGDISLPLLGEIKAAGKTTQALQAELTQKLGAKYLQSPEVFVFLKGAAGRHVTITGAVRKPGVYPVVGQLTLIQALAESGDLSDVGDPNAILVFRQQNGKRMVARFNIGNIRAGKAADPDLYPGDMVVVDTSGTRSAWHSFTQVLPVAGFFTTVATGAGLL